LEYEVRRTVYVDGRLIRNEPMGTQTEEKREEIYRFGKIMQTETIPQIGALINFSPGAPFSEGEYLVVNHRWDLERGKIVPLTLELKKHQRDVMELD
jgi:hypothetical protein